MGLLWVTSAELDHFVYATKLMSSLKSENVENGQRQGSKSAGGQNTT